MKTVAISLILSALSINCSAFTPTTTLIQHQTRISNTHLYQETATKIDNTPDWEVKQHLYGLSDNSSSTSSVTLDSTGAEVSPSSDALPLPETYITCGKCKSLFAIDSTDLGTRGKGCRVKCSVCGNSWYQSRDRLLQIPVDSHVLLPQSQANLERIQRNLELGLDPAYMGIHKLYVGNLDFRTSSEDLKAFFVANGCTQVCDVSVITGPDGRSRGFAFVTFYEEEDGKRGLECNGLECNGRELAVREPNN